MTTTRSIRLALAAAATALAIAGPTPARAQEVPVAAPLEQSFVRRGIAYINQWEQHRLTFVEADTTLQVAGWFDALGTINSIALADSGGATPAHQYVYVVSTGGVEAVEVTTPSAPVKLHTYLPSAGRETRWAKVVGATLYLADTGGGGMLRKFDVSNPSAPIQLAARVYAAPLADVNLLALDASYLVVTFDVPAVVRTSDLAIVSTIPLAGCAGQVNVGRTLYSMCKANLQSPTRLHVYDLSIVALPVSLGSVALSRVGYAPSLMSAVQQGGRRFVETYGTDGWEEEDLITIEVTTPATPIETSVLPVRFGTVHYQPFDLDVDGTRGYLYAITPYGWNPRRWFQIVKLDLSNAATPRLTSLDPVPRLPD